jgi:type-F conjugative transfer system pilin assembly protein TrbC
MYVRFSEHPILGIMVLAMLAPHVWADSGEVAEMRDALSGQGRFNAADVAPPSIDFGRVNPRADIDPATFAQPNAHGIQPDWLVPSERQPSDLARTITGDSSRALDELLDARRQSEEASAAALDGKYIVFISMSMPSQALRALFEQARERQDVVFYVRGWKPPALMDLVRRIHDAAGSSDYAVPVYVDPTAFKLYDIRHVPVILREEPNGEVRRIDGETALQGAIERIASGEEMPDYPLGNTHEIEEPDPIEFAKAKAETIDWEDKVAQARQRFTTTVTGVDVPQAARDETYYVDLTVRVQEDIEGPKGLIAKAGTQINPLASMVVKHAYVFFDPSKPRQVEVVRDWQRTHNNLVLIATRMAPVSPERNTLVADLGQPVFTLNQTLADRFQITKVPALVVADGTLLKVSVTGITESQGPENP